MQLIQLIATCNAKYYNYTKARVGLAEIVEQRNIDKEVRSIMV